MYGNVVESADEQLDQQLLPRLFGALSEDFSLSRTNFNKDSVKAGTARRVLGGLFPSRSKHLLRFWCLFPCNDLETEKLYTRGVFLPLSEGAAKRGLQYKLV